MRQIGTLSDELQARRFIDYLVTQKISALAEEDGEGWAIWVRDEERVEQATAEYKDFRANPDDNRYADVAGHAETLRREAAERRRAAAKNVVEMRGRWSRGLTRKAPATFLLIAVCVVVYLFTHMASTETSNKTYGLLAFRNPFLSEQVSDDSSPYRDIKRGQVWRLATTMLLHADHWHLFFNMYMLYYFGGQMESRKGWATFLIFVLFASVFSTLGQVVLTGPNVIGMSGVIYALFGYIWMKARFDPRSGFYIGQITVILLIGWFFAGFLPFEYFEKIANGGHGGGLLFGVVVGYLPELVPALRKFL